jgi:cell wall-associated NlpC family hydrolase
LPREISAPRFEGNCQGNATGHAAGHGDPARDAVLMSKLVLLPIGAVAALGAVALGISAFGSAVAASSPKLPLPAAAAQADKPAAAAVAYAQEQLGKPYAWGATGPASFDCSGLTYAAYQQAGVTVPRTSEQQWLALPHVPAGGAIHAGDLVFFNPGEFATGLPGHVGIYIGGGRMIDAPHTGAVVRIDAVSSFASYVGAARP